MLKSMNKPLENFNYEKCPVPVVVFKKKGTEFYLEYWNPAAVKMTGGHILNSNLQAKKMFARTQKIIDDLYRCARKKISFQTERTHFYQHVEKECHYLATYNPLPGNRVEVFLIDISRQKHYEEKILIGKETMNRLVKNSDFILIICENNLRIHYYSGPERYGLTTQEAVGKRLDRLLKIKNVEEIKTAVRKVLETESNVYHDEKKYLINGKEYWMNDNFYPIPDEKKKVKFVGYIGRDITRMKEMEERLVENEVRYQNIYERIQDGICYCEFDLRGKSRRAGFTMLDVNPAFLRIFGGTAADYIGKKGESVFRAIHNDITGNRDSLLEKKTLVYDWVSEENGKFLRTNVFHVHKENFVIVTEDVSDKKEAENRILKSEKKYREITDLVRVMILDIDDHFDVVFMNEYAQNRLFPGSRRINVNINLADIVDPKDKDRLIDGCKEILSGKEAEIKAFHLRHSEGGKIFALSNAAQIVSGEKITGVRLAIFELNEIASSIIFPDAELNKRFNLSKRESDVLFSQISGLTDQDIAEKLYISKPTVRFHITNLYNKLGVNNKRELFEFMKNNFIRKMGYENLLIYILNSFVRD